MSNSPSCRLPTSLADVRWLANLLRFDMPHERNKQTFWLPWLDAAAGTGEALVVTQAILRRTMSRAIIGYDRFTLHLPVSAVEGDPDLAIALEGKDRDLRQVVADSITDVSGSGEYGFIFLNPPYRQKDDPVIPAIAKARELLCSYGVLALVLPYYEYRKSEVIDYLEANFRCYAAFRSEEYEKVPTIVALCGKPHHHRSWSYQDHNRHKEVTWPKTIVKKWSEVDRAIKSSLTCTLPLRKMAPPLLVGPSSTRKVMGALDATVADMDQVFRTLWPEDFSRDVTPAMTLRPAHAAQLAALGSDIESITIGGTPYLARYMVRTHESSFNDPDADTTSTIRKPVVTAMLLDRHGEMRTPSDLGLDTYEVSRELTELLVGKLRKAYPPLHEVGKDDTEFQDQIGPLGLLYPQREAVRSAVKVLKKYKGAIIRGDTGTGKTFVAMGIIKAMDAKRTIMLTEPHLIPQMKEEFALLGTKVHIVNSWTKAKQFAASKREGIYIMSYARLRMSPPTTPALVTRTVYEHQNGKLDTKSRAACPDCWEPLPYHKVPRKGERSRCPNCGSALFSARSDRNDPQPPRYRDWLRQVESGTGVEHRSTDNRNLPYLRFLREIPFDLCLADEAHNAANLDSNQGEAFMRLAGHARKVIALTATVLNGYAKSVYNLAYACQPLEMKAAGWSHTSAAKFQRLYGAIKRVDRPDLVTGNIRSTTQDAPGISPAILSTTLPIFVTMHGDDFDDLPPVHREVVQCKVHPQVSKVLTEIQETLARKNLPVDVDYHKVGALRTAAMLRAPDTFCHYDDVLAVSNQVLGVIRRHPVRGLQDKEKQLVRIIAEATGRGERVLVYTGLTQKFNMRSVLKTIIETHAGVTADILDDNIAPERVVEWFRNSTAPVAIVSYKRAGTGLNLSQYTNVVWYDYTTNPRIAEQAEGRVRRVNSAMIHRRMFGQVRHVRYYYLVATEIQSFQLSYTLEKRMVSKLAEGEVPDIDPGDCGVADESFTSLLAKALQNGSFDHTDPGQLLRRMTQAENAQVSQQNLQAVLPKTIPAPTPASVLSILPAQTPRAKPMQLSLF